MLINVPASNLVAALDDALQAIEDSGDTLKGCVKLSLFTSVKIQSNELKKVVDEVNKISHKVFGEEKDLIGRVYEYFLKSFAVNATKEEGEFYTPHDIVELIAAFIDHSTVLSTTHVVAQVVCLFNALNMLRQSKVTLQL